MNKSVIFSISNNNDLQVLSSIIEKFGYKPVVISEEEQQMKARQQIVKIASSSKRNNVSDSEIIQELKAIRVKRHEQKV